MINQPEPVKFSPKLLTIFDLFTVPWVACASSPCNNDGSCIDVNVNTYICMCRDGYFGVNCGESELTFIFIRNCQEEYDIFSQCWFHLRERKKFGSTENS